MDKWQPTPTDEVGMPYVLRPPEYSVLFDRTDLFDRNHAWHPSTHPQLKDEAGEALKNSRVQFTDWWEHHMIYHGRYDGPELPTSRAEKFGLVVLSCAMYVPDMALDCRDIDPKEVRLSESEKLRLWTSGELYIPGPSIVRNFLTSYTLEQDLSHVKENKIDEFLNTTDLDRRRFLGHWLLSQATDKAAEPIELLYRQAWKLGRIPSELPAKPSTVVQTRLGTVKNRDNLFGKLEEKLADAA